MHSNRTHAIFWAPAGWSFASSYESAVQAFLSDVATDSGKYGNVYATDRQYYDATGVAASSSSSTAFAVDTDPYPTSGCTAGSTCLTDSQLQTELRSYISSHSLPTGLGDSYFVFTPSGVNSCIDGSSTQCSTNTYCAYHSSFHALDGSSILYSNLPFPPSSGCSAGQHPNPADPNADTIINSLSHEHNETITDPLGDAWFTASGNENGDNCNGNFGPQSGTAPAQYNQTIAGAHFDLQTEWSNVDGACVQSYDRPSFAVAPRLPRPNQSVAFDAGSSDNGAGAITSYSWNFGDGSVATGATPTHAYAGGPATVTLTVTRSDGSASTTAQRLVELNQPVCSPASASTTGAAIPMTLACANPGGGDSVALRSIVAGPAHGTLGSIDQAAGIVMYTPTPGYAGSDSFTFSATDHGGFSGSATANVSISPPPAAAVSAPPGVVAVPPQPGLPPVTSSTPTEPVRVTLRLPSNVFASGRGRVRANAQISYQVERAGFTSFTLERRVSGVRRAGRCVASATRVRRARRCETFVRQGGEYTHRDAAGDNRLSLAQVLGRRRLAAGSYRLVAAFRAPDGATGRADALFRIR
ncbi:MAG: hypothetical protein NVS2B6_03610 [Thermoleophilaceae bacterium]